MRLMMMLSKMGVCSTLLFSFLVHASGVVPNSSIVIIEESEGEIAIDVKNTDPQPVLMLTNIEDLPVDTEKLVTVSPPATRVEAGKTQRVRFILVNQTPLTTERLKRVTFEGIPPKEKGKNQVQVTVRQNLPLLIRPKGLAIDEEPWKRLVWQIKSGNVVVSNPSPYVVRLSQSMQTQPDKIDLILPQTFVLPGQELILKTKNSQKAIGNPKHIRIYPATTWGFSSDSWDAPIMY